MKRLYWILGSVVLLLLVLCVIGALPLEFALLLLFGWIGFLIHTLPEVSVNWGDVGVGFLALGAFALLTHWFCSWLMRERQRAKSGHLVEAESLNQTWKWRWSAAIVALVVLMFVAGTAMIGVVHQTTWLLTMEERMFDYGMQAAYRNGSLNNARQLSLAAANHDSATRSLPAGCTVDSQGRMLHGWTTQLLPYIEEVQLYQQIDLQQPWNAPANDESFRMAVGAFRNPGAEDYEDDRGYPLAHYASNAHVIGGDERRKLADIRDGTSKTLLFGEVTDNCKAWGSTTNWRDPALGLGQSPDGFRGPWSGNVTIMTFADGHAQAIPNDVDPRVLRAIATPAGGEEFEAEDLE
jgi:hypothetical protein